MCETRNDFRPKIAWEFYKIAKEQKEYFNKIEKYWMLFFANYQQEVFEEIYNTLEITLTWHEKYNSHKELLKKAAIIDINKGIIKKPWFNC